MKTKIFIILIILSFAMTMSSVTAEDTNCTQNVSLGYEDNSFFDLDLEIDNSFDSVDLQKDYAFDESFDYYYRDEGIRITRSITINGNGHSIDARGVSRIFSISASNVILNNITFKNANSRYGGAINWYGGSGQIINSTFINNTALDGAAIFALNSTIHISNTKFDKNSVSYMGGSIYQMYGTLEISNTSFSNNSAHDGGAICIDSYDSFKAINSDFISNLATRYGGAICILFNSNFNNQSSRFSNNHANKGKDTYFVSIEEILNITPINTTLIQYNSTDITSIPSYYNLADEGHVTSVKNQGDDGNCWAFASLAALESAILKATGKTFDFSENNMKNIAARFSDYGWDSDPNSGGHYLMVIGYLASWLGPVDEMDDEYRDNSNIFSNLLDALYHVQDIAYLKRSTYTDNDAIKSAVMNYGAVVASIYWSNSYVRGGSYYCYRSQYAANHAVTIVGWDDNYSKNNFRTSPSGDGAWIIKNSWGSDSGNNGYYYVSYYDRNFALDNIGMNYVFILNDTLRYDNIYQHEIAKTGYFYGINDTVIWGKTYYVAEKDEFLAGVSTYFDVDSDYELYIDVESNGVNKYSFSQNASSSAGYHTIKINKPIFMNKGDVFTITIKYVGNGHLPISMDEAMVKNYSYSNISYAKTDDDDWEDLSNYNSVVCIKAFTASKLNTFIELSEIENIFISKDFNLTATVRDQLGNLIDEGQLTFLINNAEYTVNVTNGIAQINLSFFNFGNYDLTCSFIAPHYYSSSLNTQFYVDRYPTNLTLSVNDVFSSQDVFVKINITNGPTGFITLKLNDTFIKEFEIENTEILHVLSNLAIGNYTISAYYGGDNNFADSFISKVFEVKALPSSIEILQINNVYYGNDITIPFNITEGVGGNVEALIYKNNTLIKNQIFNINSSIIFSNLDAGSYTVCLNYLGDGIHAGCMSSYSTFKILKANSNISIIPIANVVYGSDLYANISLINGSGGYYQLISNSSIIKTGDLTNMLVFSDLSAGNYTLYVFNIGDNNHNSSDATSNFTIYKNKSDISINLNSNIVYGQDILISFYVADKATGNVNVSILRNKNLILSKLMDVSEAYVIFSNLDAGQYDVIIAYSGDVNYTDCSNNSSFTVCKSISGIDIVLFEDIYYGEDLFVNIQQINGTGGYYELIFNNSVIKTGELSDLLVFSDLSAGNYSLLAVNYGDNNHNSSSTLTNFTVKNANSKVLIGKIIDAVYGSDVLIPFKLSNNATGLVNVSILSDNKVISWKVVDVNLGNVVFSNLGVGKYDVQIDYYGDGNYFNSSDNSSFTVFKAASDIQIKSFENITYLNNLTINVTLINGSDAFYELSFNNSLIKTATLTNPLVFSNLLAGKYSLYIFNEGDNNHNSSYKTIDFEVYKANSSVSIGNISDVFYNDDVLIPFKISGGLGVVNVSVLSTNQFASKIVSINDEEVIFSNLDAGEYSVNIIYLGDSNFASSSKVSSFKVLKSSSSIKILPFENTTYLDDLYIDVNWINGSDVYYELVFNNSIIKTGILTNPLVLLNLSVGNYCLYVFNNGDNNHNPSNAEAKFSIYKINSTILIGDKLDINYGEDLSIPFTINNNAMGLLNVAILSNNQIIVNKVVDANSSYVTFSNLSVGQYTINMIYSGDNNFFNSSATASFSVFKSSSAIEILPFANVSYMDDLCIDINWIGGNSGFYELSFNGSVIERNYLKKSLILYSLFVGNYSLYVFNEGDANHNSSYARVNFTVEKKKSIISMNVNSQNVFGNNIEIEFELNHFGNVTLSVYKDSDLIINEPIGFNFGRIVISDMARGTYTAVISYEGNDNYTDGTISSIFTITQAPSYISLFAQSNVTYPDSIDVNLTLINGSKASYQLFRNGILINEGYISNSFIITNLNAGNYTLNVTNIGDSNHKSSNAKIDFVVNKANSSISTANIGYVIFGKDAIIPFDITGVSGDVKVNLISNGAVLQTKSVNVNDKQVTFRNLNIGSYNVSFEYLGDENHIGCYNETSFEIISPISDISLKLTSKQYNKYQLISGGEVISFRDVINLKTGNYTIKMFDNSKYINAIDFALIQDFENLTIIFNGNIYVKSIKNSLKLTIVDFNADVEAILIVNNMFTNITVEDREVIKTGNFDIIVPKSIVVTNENNTIPIYLPDDAQGTISVKINDLTYSYNVVNGKANVVLPQLNNGVYQYSVTYSGDNKYLKASASASFEVKSNVEDAVVIDPDSVIVDSLELDFGYGMGGNVTLTLNNQKICVDIHDSQAVFDLTSFMDGTYSYVISYSGDSNNAGFTKSGVLTIKNMKSTVILANVLTTKYLNVDYLIATLKDGDGNILKQMDVDVLINDEIETLTTDDNGQVKLLVSLNPGQYIAEITFDGDTFYNSTSLDVKITVLKANLKLTISKKTFKKSLKTKKFKIILKNSKNKVIKNYKIVLKIKGKKYTQKTNKKGVVTFKLSKLTKKGSYSAKIIVNANKYYASLSKTVKIKVK